MIVRRRKTQSKIIRHRTTVIRSSYDHRATLIYKTILASHHAIIVKSYVIVRLSYDYRTTIVRLSYDYRTTIVRLSYDYRTTIVRLSYDYHTTIIRLSYDYRTTIVRLSYDYRTTVVRLSYDYRSTVVRFTYALTSHQAIIMKSYVIVRLSLDCRTMSYDVVRCSTISHKLSMCRKPIVSSVTTKLRLQYRSRIGENLINLRCHPSRDVAARCDQGLRSQMSDFDTCSHNVQLDLIMLLVNCELWQIVTRYDILEFSRIIVSTPNRLQMDSK